MHFNTLDHLRQQMYGCLQRSGDALFTLSDALLRRVASAQSARIVAVGLLRASLAQRLTKRCKMGASTWSACARSSCRPCWRTNRKKSRSGWALIVQHATSGGRKQPRSWQNLYAEYAPCDQTSQRGLAVFDADALAQTPSSWVGILEQRRIGSEQTAIEVSIEQLRAVLPQCESVRSSCWRIAGTPPPALCTPVTN